MTARDLQLTRTQRMLFLSAVILLAGLFLVLPRLVDLSLGRYLVALFAAAGLALLLGLIFSILRWLKPITDPPPVPRWLMITFVARLTIFAASFLTIVVMLVSLPFGWGSQALNQSALLGLLSATLVSLWGNAVCLGWERFHATPSVPPTTAR